MHEEPLLVPPLAGPLGLCDGSPLLILDVLVPRTQFAKFGGFSPIFLTFHGLLLLHEKPLLVLRLAGPLGLHDRSPSVILVVLDPKEHIPEFHCPSPSFGH